MSYHLTMKRLLGGMLVVAVLAGCERRVTEAIVLEKEYIPMRAPTPTPSPKSTTETAEPAAETESRYREMEPDEIAVGDVVMKAELRGTNRDPRAREFEQWLVTVRLLDIGDRRTLQTERDRFNQLHPGDRVTVAYRIGKYTRSVWYTELR